MMRALLENLFVRNEPQHGERQRHTLFAWIKGSVEALRAGKMKEAQALAMAGPPQSGKSLLQRLLTHLLGGRECKPFLFLAGKTPFNAELFEAEHLTLEDEHMSRKLHDRLALGAAIKAIVANEAHHCHPELAESLHGLSPASALLGLIDALAPWGEASNEWEGTAEELRSRLFNCGATGTDARRLLEWPQACGNYLATLAKKNAARVQPHRTSNARLWIIRRP